MDNKQKEIGWISHGRTFYRPLACMDLISVDIKQMDGTYIEGVHPQNIAWETVKQWRPSIGLTRIGNVEDPAPTDKPSVQETLNERGKTHGDFSAQAGMSQNLKMLMRSSKFNDLTFAQREALDAITMKISRIIHGNPNEPDHWRDIAGYATLVENILVHGKSHLG